MEEKVCSKNGPIINSALFGPCSRAWNMGCPAYEKLPIHPQSINIEKNLIHTNPSVTCINLKTLVSTWKTTLHLMCDTQKTKSGPTHSIKLDWRTGICWQRAPASFYRGPAGKLWHQTHNYNSQTGKLHKRTKVCKICNGKSGTRYTCRGLKHKNKLFHLNVYGIVEHAGFKKDDTDISQ